MSRIYYSVSNEATHENGFEGRDSIVDASKPHHFIKCEEMQSSEQWNRNSIMYCELERCFQSFDHVKHSSSNFTVGLTIEDNIFEMPKMGKGQSEYYLF